MSRFLPPHFFVGTLWSFCRSLWKRIPTSCLLRVLIHREGGGGVGIKMEGPCQLVDKISYGISEGCRTEDQSYWGGGSRIAKISEGCETCRAHFLRGYICSSMNFSEGFGGKRAFFWGIISVFFQRCVGGGCILNGMAHSKLIPVKNYYFLLSLNAGGS